MKIWLVGAYGIVSTTAMIGAKGLERDIVDSSGLVSELPIFDDLKKYAPLSFDFGGHEIRMLKNAYEASMEHWELNRHFDIQILDGVKEDLVKIRASKGTALNCGSGIEGLGKIETLEGGGLSLKEVVEESQRICKAFVTMKRL